MSKGILKIAVASGKGGTGKSCVTSSLAAFSGHLAVDADVEEPNLALLLDMKPSFLKNVEVLVPLIDEERCIDCGKCSRYCRYGAIADIGHGKPFLNPKLCHSCGVCKMVCPVSAITETPKRIGEIRRGISDQLELIEGNLDVGMINSIPVIEKAIETAETRSHLLIIDSPPGTSCPVVATLQNADLAILVTEPTPFGAADLELALQLASDLGIPGGIVINRSDIAKVNIHELGEKYNFPVLAEFPFSRAVAESYARGISPFFIDKNWQDGTKEIWEYIKKELSL